MNLRASVFAVIALTLMIDAAAAAQSDDVAGAAQSDDLDPDAEEIAQIRNEHLAELMKIPHVVGVAIELNERGEVVLDVEVDEPENVSDVERKAPPRVEGFPLDVELVPSATDGFSTHGSLSTDSVDR
jgi:hypothetical protein